MEDGDNSAVQRSSQTGKVADEAELTEGTSVEGPVEEKTSVKGLHRFLFAFCYMVVWCRLLALTLLTPLHCDLGLNLMK